MRIGPGEPDGEVPDQPDAQAYHTKWVYLALLWRQERDNRKGSLTSAGRTKRSRPTCGREL
jgi:hypothetical protein